MEWPLFFAYLLGYAICSGANVGFFAFSQRELRRQSAFGAKLDATEAEQRIARRALAIQPHLRDPNWTLVVVAGVSAVTVMAIASSSLRERRGPSEPAR